MMKSFSCVVGPNGSGKNNVIYSIMFVLGYRSSRIRSKDLRSLIHKSNDHSNIDKCTVEVHFIQIQDTEPLRRKLNDKLRVFQEKRRIQLEQVKRVEAELNMLKEPMLVVVDYLKTKNKISQLNNMKFQYIKYQAEREMNQKQSKKEELENALKQDEETAAKQLSSRRIEYDKALLRQMRKDVDGLTVKCETEHTSRNEAQRTLEDLEKQLPDLENVKKNDCCKITPMRKQK